MVTRIDSTREHGGPDAGGAAAFDFSVNANGNGPCPRVLRALAAVDATHYPDATYHRLRRELADFHRVAFERIVTAGSASEFIYRVTSWVARRGGRRVVVPAFAYGDYAHAARLWGLSVERLGDLDASANATANANSTANAIVPADALEEDRDDVTADLVWACDPSSPTGASPAEWRDGASPRDAVRVLDRAYDGLRLSGESAWTDTQRDQVWQLFTPNKSLGLTGVRGAYAISPIDQSAAALELREWAPSWVLGAHGVALLSAWTDAGVQSWLADSRQQLREWKTRQLKLFNRLGLHDLPGDCSFYCARLPLPATMDDVGRQRVARALLVALRARGVQLRDASSFGLPGVVRASVLPPAAQQAFERAWREVAPDILGTRHHGDPA